jgi:hypothetical protein
VSTCALSRAVPVSVTRRILDYCICFALSTGFRAPSAPFGESQPFSPTIPPTGRPPPPAPARHPRPRRPRRTAAGSFRLGAIGLNFVLRNRQCQAPAAPRMRHRAAAGIPHIPPAPPVARQTGNSTRRAALTATPYSLPFLSTNWSLSANSLLSSLSLIDLSASSPFWQKN